MNKLTDELLIDTYLLAIRYNCESEFIQMLAHELQRRGLQPSNIQYSA